MASARRLASRRIYEGRVLSLDVDDVEEHCGIRAVREVVRHRGSVAALAVRDDGHVVLVKQYRYPVDEDLWELPAGRLDPGETPAEGARRELEEEAGVSAAELEPIALYYTTPGFCDEAMHLFRATKLTRVAARPEPDERIEAAWYSLEEARAMIERGEVREGKTLVALLLESERRRQTVPSKA